jgi:hypothetical protein
LAKTKKVQAVTEVEIIDPVQDGAIATDAQVQLQVSTGDTVAIAVSEFERRVEREVAEGSRIIAKLDQELEEARHELHSALDKAIDKHQSEVTKTGEPFYKARGLTFGFDKKLQFDEDRDKTEFGVQYTLYSTRTKYRGYHGQQSKPDWSYENEIEYTDTMTHKQAGTEDLYRNIVQLKQARGDALRVQTEWRQRLSSVISVERQTRAELAKAALNQSETGSQLVEAITANFEERFFGGVTNYSDMPKLEGRTASSEETK